MSVNQLEATLQAVTHTLAKLEKEGCNDEKLLSELRKERDNLRKYKWKRRWEQYGALLCKQSDFFW